MAILTDPLEGLISEWVANVYSGQAEDIAHQIPQVLDGAFVRDSISHVDEVRQSMAVLDDTLHYRTDNLTLLDLFHSTCDPWQGADTFSTFLVFAKVVHRLVESQETGQTRECPRCGNLLAIDAFADSSLTTRVGRICNECKARSRSRTGPACKMKAQASTMQDTARKDCPKCGSPMVRRTGRYGAFYGCSTYPKCRGTRRI